MNLEDHLGDIIRKGRLASGIAVAVAAQAAGLSVPEFGALEESGHAPPSARLSALATAIGLDGPKLERVARGWLPEVPNLESWREVRQITTTAHDMSVHCYLIWDEVLREAALFDTGWNAAPILQIVEENGLTLPAPFSDAFPRRPCRRPGRTPREISQSPPAHQLQEFAPQHRNRSNDFVHLGSLRITNRDTPGHAEDGVTYIVGNFPDDVPHVALVGDAIFAGSIGRGNQSWELARQKVREQILTLPPETLLCPGHGPLTTVAEEKAANPFF